MTNPAIPKINTSSLETQRDLRIKKLEKLRALGIDPFPAESKRDYTLREVKEDFEGIKNHIFPTVREVSTELKEGYNNPTFSSKASPFLRDNNKLVTLAGRIKSKRGSGKIAFVSLEDESLPEGFQLVLKKDELAESKKVWELNIGSEESYNRIVSGNKTIDIRALNPEYTQALYSQFQAGEIIVFNNKINNQKVHGITTKVTFFKSLEEAFDSGLDFGKATDLVNSNFAALEKYYLDKLGQEYLNKIATNGLVAIEFQKYDYKLTFQDFKELIDEGDYIQATGYLETTIAGEPSLFVTEFKLLTKSLRPLPDKLEYDNLEARYLDRVADFKMNTKDSSGRSVRDLVYLKSRFWQIWREEMLAEGFLEVETPTLELIPGGAEAKTFNTFYNELDTEVVLRISPELSLKKLQAGGFEKIFEIGKNFRNEGSSPQHLQEYTAIEWYCAYEDYTFEMKSTKKVYQRIANEILNSEVQTDYYGNIIHWGNWCTQEEAAQNNWELVDGWPKIKYFDAVRYFSKGKIDTENKTAEELVVICNENSIHDVKVSDGLGALLDKLWKKARLNTTNPFFLVLPPVELEPLAKRNGSNFKLTERFQIVAGKAELGKGFSELNDPIDQFGRFEEQQAARDAGNDEAQAMDQSYVKAMEYGMPPMAGFGTSERLLSFLLGKHIKECVTFPHIRAEDDKKKSKHTIVNHAIVLKDLEMWKQVNAYSHLSASFGARTGKSLFTYEHLNSGDGQKINMNIGSAIINKVAASSEELKKLKAEAEQQGLQVEIFTQEMQETTDDSKIAAIYKSKSYQDIQLLGILISGKKLDVEKLTKNFELFGNTSSSDNSVTKTDFEANSKIEDSLTISKSKTNISDFQDIFTQAGLTYPFYWQDTFNYTCPATVKNIASDEKGSYVILDQTVFYPQGGGQPTDIGVLKNRHDKIVFRVDFVAKNQGIFLHYGELVDELKEGEAVICEIDSETRKINARLHTVSHVMDVAMQRLHPHLLCSKAYCFPQGPYIEYVGELGQFEPEVLTNEMNSIVNELIDENHTVIKSYSHDNAHIIQHIKIADSKDNSELNNQHCGGTHLDFTGTIGKYHTRGISYKKGILKIKFAIE